MDEVAIERVRVALVVLDPKEDVGRAAGAVLGQDHRRADHPLGREVLEHEQVLAIGDRDRGVERRLRQLQDALEVVALGRQVHGVEVLGHLEDLVDVFAPGLSDPEHAGPPPTGTAPYHAARGRGSGQRGPEPGVQLGGQRRAGGREPVDHRHQLLGRELAARDHPDRPLAELLPAPVLDRDPVEDRR